MLAIRCIAFLIAGGFVFLLNSGDATAETPGTWVRPDGFRAPSIWAGQYSFRVGVGISGYERKWQEELNLEWWEALRGGRNTTDEWELRSHLTYALTDEWVIMTGATFVPGQESDDSHRWTITEDELEGSHRREHLDHRFSTYVTVAFKPLSLVELYISGGYSKSKSKDGTVYTEEFSPGTSNGKDRRKSYSIFAGINIAR